jgi:hypothetical protein
VNFASLQGANACMFSDGKAIVQRLGYAALILGSLLLFLYVMNLRSRFHYSGPDYSFLFWLFAWAAPSIESRRLRSGHRRGRP